MVLNIHTTRLRRAQALVLGHEDFGAADAAQQEKLVEVLLDIVEQCGHEIPSDPTSQIIAAVKAVVLSNDNHISEEPTVLMKMRQLQFAYRPWCLVIEMNAQALV